MNRSIPFVGSYNYNREDCKFLDHGREQQRGGIILLYQILSIHTLAEHKDDTKEKEDSKYVQQKEIKQKLKHTQNPIHVCVLPKEVRSVEKIKQGAAGEADELNRAKFPC